MFCIKFNKTSLIMDFTAHMIGFNLEKLGIQINYVNINFWKKFLN